MAQFKRQEGVIIRETTWEEREFARVPRVVEKNAVRRRGNWGQPLGRRDALMVELQATSFQKHAKTFWFQVPGSRPFVPTVAG